MPQASFLKASNLLRCQTARTHPHTSGRQSFDRFLMEKYFILSVNLAHMNIDHVWIILILFDLNFKSLKVNLKRLMVDSGAILHAGGPRSFRTGILPPARRGQV